MRAIGVIPARYGAQRFPGKLLADLCGKPVLQWVIELALQANELNEVIVATDDTRISTLAEKCGVEAVMTSPDISSGTDRAFVATEKKSFDVLVNIQGDEPLLPVSAISQLIEPLRDKKRSVSTLAAPIDPKNLTNSHRVKVIPDAQSNAIYFSRLPVPYSRGALPEENCICLQHIGVYGFQREALKRFYSHPVSDLERAEGLEQLRFLAMGEKIAISQVDHLSPGVDTPEDLVEIEKIIQTKVGHGVKIQEVDEESR